MTRGDFLRNLIGLYGIASIPAALVKQYQKVYLLQCFVRGFQYYEGPNMIHEINESGLLELVREPENKYDKNAIALYFNQKKIGFIPRESNEMLAVLLDTGLLELQAEVTYIEPSAMDWEKIHVAVYVMKALEEGISESLLPYTLLQTPRYYTLKSNHDTYTRIYVEENEPLLDGEQFYETLVQHSTTDDIYTLIHTAFPNPEDLEEAVNESRLVVNQNTLSPTRSLAELAEHINNEMITLTDLTGKDSYVVANCKAIASIPDAIDRFEAVVGGNGTQLYEVVFK